MNHKFTRLASLATTIITTFAVTLAMFAAPVALAKSDNAQIPEVDGVYAEPGNPHIKVRVIVHKARGGNNSKPGPSYTLQCGLADPDSTAVVPVAGWKLGSNVEYRLNPGSVPSGVGAANLATIAQNGFSDWSAATNGKVTFTRGADTSTSRQGYDGQNIIAWGRTSGSALAVTYIRYNSVSGAVVDVDTIMNKSFNWKWASGDDCAYTNAYDAEDILTHEQGHWMGLDDTYSTAFINNTMYGYGSTFEAKKKTLTTGDRAGAYGIYN